MPVNPHTCVVIHKQWERGFSSPPVSEQSHINAAENRTCHRISATLLCNSWDDARSGSKVGAGASYSPSWEMQSIAEVSGESPGIKFKPCHYKSPSAKQFVQQLITAVKQRSHGAILWTEGKAVATGERRLGDKSKANMPQLIGQKRLNLPPIPAAWQEKTEHRLWAGKYMRASAWTSHADIRHLVSALAQTGGFFSRSLEAGCLHSCPWTLCQSSSLKA